MKLYFVTPAWKRYELTEVVLDQRVRVMAELATHGIEAHCVVVADDANLDIARERGLDTIEAPNVVSDRFNAGMAYAGEHGADWIVPIGSDSWIDPGYFENLHDGVTRTSQLYCHVTADRIGLARVRRRAGAGPYVFHRDVLATVGFRPAAPGLMRYVDSSTIANLERHTRLAFRNYHRHPYQYVGFRVAPYITSYRALMNAWGVAEHSLPWDRLTEHYPLDLVERARAVFG